MLGFQLTFQGVQHMDPKELAQVAQNFRTLAGMVESQTAGLNPATTTALKEIAKQMKSNADKLVPPTLDVATPTSSTPKPGPDLPSQAKPASTK